MTSFAIVRSFQGFVRVRLLSLAAVILMTGGCGQIGPLYLPEEAPAPPPTETPEDEQEQQDNS